MAKDHWGGGKGALGGEGVAKEHWGGGVEGGGGGGWQMSTGLEGSCSMRGRSAPHRHQGAYIPTHKEELVSLCGRGWVTFSSPS